jgi:hypothetical protein
MQSVQIAIFPNIFEDFSESIIRRRTEKSVWESAGMHGGLEKNATR